MNNQDKPLSGAIVRAVRAIGCISRSNLEPENRTEIIRAIAETVI
jgi:hypothetical protein